MFKNNLVYDQKFPLQAPHGQRTSIGLCHLKQCRCQEFFLCLKQIQSPTGIYQEIGIDVLKLANKSIF